MIALNVFYKFGTALVSSTQWTLRENGGSSGSAASITAFSLSYYWQWEGGMSRTEFL